MQPHPRIRQGQVYGLDDCEPLDDDHRKRRPVIVVGVKGAHPVVVVAATTQFRSSEPDLVKLPNKLENPQTTSGLPRPCWAVPRWFFPVQPARLVVPVGYISGATLRKIVEAVSRRVRLDLDTESTS